MHARWQNFLQSALLAGLLVSSQAAAQRPMDTGSPTNLALQARIAASSQYSAAYDAQQLADGHVPAAMSHADVGKAWCAQGNHHPQGVRLTFDWAAPVHVAELVYFGRTAWQWEENWRDYELRDGADDKLLAAGQLQAGHGPQRIKLSKPIITDSLVLHFTSSYGGSNPGASEIEIYSAPRPDSYYASFHPPRTNRQDIHKAPISDVPESDALAGQVASGQLGFTSLIVVHRHTVDPTHVYTYHVEGQQPGGGLYRLHLAPADGSGGTPVAAQLTRLVDATEGLILDANISYDGNTVLFSWKRTMADKLQLYTIGTDGTGLCQLTDHDSNNLNACWLPDDSIAFLSDRKPAYAYCWTSSTPILYRCQRDGSQVQRLSANYLNDFTPAVMEDGRVVYSRWEYVDRPAIPIQSLWTINPDGTHLSGLFGNRVLSPATFMEAQEIPGTGKLLCVLTSHNGPCRGAVGIIDPAKGANEQLAIENLTPEIDTGLVDRGDGNHIRGPYESPFPIDDQYFLVSRDGSVLLRDYAGTAQATLLESAPDMGYYTPRPIMSRPRPPLRSSGYPLTEDNWASVLVEDVYKGLQLDDPAIRIERIAVVQEVEKSKFADVKQRAFGFQFPVVSCGATYAPKKVWGFARVYEDGSAHFRVPAGLPIYFMALDQQGRAIQRMRSFTHLMPGERQSCVGCHANRNYVTPNVTAGPLAATRPPEALIEPEWGVRGFSYPHIVQPVLDEHCVECHDARERAAGIDLSGDRTDFFNVSYETLARQGKPGENPYTKWIPTFNGQEANILHVDPQYWGSPASRLADIVLGGHPDELGKPRVHMDQASRQRVLTWIDLNVPYYGTSASNHYDLTGCRRMVPTGLDEVLQDVAQRRCVSCHAGPEGIPREPFVRITNVHHNSFLLAPLAQTAGGTERCGQAVFDSKLDPDYQKILQVFESIDQLLRENPRMDLTECND
jgi:hypothetical protein